MSLSEIQSIQVEAKNQQHLADILIEATEKVMSQQEGFISANIHKSLDGTRVVNYAQWTSKEAFEKRLKNPRAIVHMDDALSIESYIKGTVSSVEPPPNHDGTSFFTNKVQSRR